MTTHNHNHYHYRGGPVPEYKTFGDRLAYIVLGLIFLAIPNIITFFIGVGLIVAAFMK